MKKIIVLLAVLAFGVIVLTFLRYFIYHKLSSKVYDEISTLNSGDFEITYDTLLFDWQKNEVELRNLTVKKKSSDSICKSPEFISSNFVKVSGLGLWKLALKKDISVANIVFDSLEISLYESTQFFLDTKKEPAKNDLNLSLDNITFNGFKAQILDSASCEIKTVFKTSGNVKYLEIHKQPDQALRWELNDFILHHSILGLGDADYTFEWKELRARLNRQIMAIDSIRIIPHFSKLQFGREAGHDVDRFEGVLPYLHFAGLRINTIDTFALSIQKMGISFNMDIFHDKRLPHRQIRKPLPIENLRRLSFGLRIDTIDIQQSYVRYEEFGKDADEPGHIFFDNIKGRITHLHNDHVLTNGEMKIQAEARFMGDGKLEMVTTLPYNNDQPSRMTGSLNNFDLQKINKILAPMVKLSVESGRIKKLNFNFDYNDKRSNGNVLLNYEGLKLVTFKPDDKLTRAQKRKKARGNADESIKKDNLKTFVLNTFVIRKDLNEKVPIEDRSGQVIFERDQTRSVFHFWWKSLFTGVKSAANLDRNGS